MISDEELKLLHELHSFLRFYVKYQPLDYSGEIDFDINKIKDDLWGLIEKLENDK